MNPTEIILKKRNGGTLSRSEIDFFLTGYLDGKIPDYQMSAFLMAVYFQKMNFEETANFTDVMLKTGVVVDLSSIPGIKVDKHSTGGIGDKVSLILAPMVAACGVPVPMVSGRGLGHTGGTLDKLESIPRFNSSLSIEEYKKVVSEIGVVMIGQTSEIAPADKKIYALRDVTGTVECISLIAGSIMSKKLAEGIDALVLDVKVGNGAFMKSLTDAIELANILISIGTRFGKPTIGFLTDMNQPLGYAVGNWLEVVECIECMKGKQVDDLMKITYLLGGAMVMLGEKANTIDDGIKKCRHAIESGLALNKFKEMVSRQGGDIEVIENIHLYPPSKFIVEVKSPESGYVVSIDALEVGFISIMLGAGRMKTEDQIDSKAGIIFTKKVGDYCEKGETLALLYTDRELIINDAIDRFKRAVSILNKPTVAPPLIYGMIDKEGFQRWDGVRNDI